MLERVNHKYRTTSYLVTGTLGAVLLASPWLTALGESTQVAACAVSGGALLLRLSLSSLLHPRVWKVKGRMLVGAMVALAPWALGMNEASPLSWLFHLVGLITFSLAVAEFWPTLAAEVRSTRVARWIEAAARFLFGRGRLPC